MRVNNVNGVNYNQSNLNFKGYIDKSVYDFIHCVKSDIVKTKPKNASANELKMMIEDVPYIIDKLSGFMKKFHPNTRIGMSETRTTFGLEIQPFFENTKTKTNILGFRVNGEREYENGVSKNGINVQRYKIPLPTPDFFGIREKWTAFSVHQLRHYVEELMSSNISPEALDKNLFNKMVEEMDESSNLPMFKLFGDFLAKRRGKKADKLAPEFGFEPVYKDRFLKIAQKAREDEKVRIQEENLLKNLINDLKNMKIK